MDFETVWDNIIKHEGEVFYTITKLPFVYKVQGNRIVHNRTKFPLQKSEFEKAMQYMPLTSPSQINKVVRGPAYIYAILTDGRIN